MWHSKIHIVFPIGSAITLAIILVGMLSLSGCSGSDTEANEMTIVDVTLEEQVFNRVIFLVQGELAEGCVTFSHFEMDGDGYEYTIRMLGEEDGNDECSDGPSLTTARLDVSVDGGGQYYFNFGGLRERVYVKGELSEPLIITIGNLTDLTGPSSSVSSIITLALEDMVKHYNERNLIPGVELRVLTYDGQSDVARDIPGYAWLREKGADVMFSPISSTPITLKHMLAEDEVVLFALNTTAEATMPPGFVFSLSASPQKQAYTVLKWIAENDWDYEANGPAKVGGAGWNDDYTISLHAAVEEYCDLNPDQFEFMGGYRNNYSFVWDTEIEALKDCDYVFPCSVLYTFVPYYRDAGGTAKFVGTDVHTGYLKIIDDKELWNEMEGALFVRSGMWWTDESSMIELTKELLYENYPDEAEEFVRGGSGYLSVGYVHMMLEMIGNTVDKSSLEFFDSRALYEIAESFSTTVDGCPHSFDQTKHTSSDTLMIYEVRAEEKDIFRIGSDWIPIVIAP